MLLVFKLVPQLDNWPDKHKITIYLFYFIVIVSLKPILANK